MGSWYCFNRGKTSRAGENAFLSGRCKSFSKVSNKKLAEDKAVEMDDALERGEPWEWAVGRTKAGERTFAEVVEEFLTSTHSAKQSTQFLAVKST